MKYLHSVLHITLIILLLIAVPSRGRSDREDPPEGEEKSVRVLSEGRSGKSL